MSDLINAGGGRFITLEEWEEECREQSENLQLRVKADRCDTLEQENNRLKNEVARLKKM